MALNFSVYDTRFVAETDVYWENASEALTKLTKFSLTERLAEDILQSEIQKFPFNTVDGSEIRLTTWDGDTIL